MTISSSRNIIVPSLSILSNTILAYKSYELKLIFKKKKKMKMKIFVAFFKNVHLSFSEQQRFSTTTKSKQNHHNKQQQTTTNTTDLRAALMFSNTSANDTYTPTTHQHNHNTPSHTHHRSGVPVHVLLQQSFKVGATCLTTVIVNLTR